MKRVFWSCLPIAMLAVGLVPARLEAAALLPANQQKIEAADESLRHAAELYRKHKLEDFGKLIDEVGKTLEELKSSDQKNDAAPMIEQLELRLASAQKLMKYALDSTATAKGPAKKVAGKPTPKTDGPPAGQADAIRWPRRCRPMT